MLNWCQSFHTKLGKQQMEILDWMEMKTLKVKAHLEIMQDYFIIKFQWK